MNKTKDGWIRTSKGIACPICEAPDWCTISPDGSLCCCMRAESAWPVKNGGWIHKLHDSPTVPFTARRIRVPQPAAPEETIDWKAMLTSFRAGTDIDAIRSVASSLGVSTESLLRLGIVRAAQHQAWAFPMFDEKARIIGVRLRSNNGDKWAVKGSRQGLFWPIGKMQDDEPVLVCEGPTDTASMLDLGFFVIGRPSCSACVDMTVSVLTGRDVVILGDRDTPKPRPNGTTWLPGREGAEKLANALVIGKARSVRIIYPPARFKDARDWRRGGANNGLVRAVISQQMPWRPKA